MPTAQFWWYVRKKSLLKINLPDYVREKLTVAVSLLVSARTVQERAYFFLGNRAREWEMLQELAAERRKEMARKAAKAPWDEKRREGP
jgi:hypothetical protein